MIDEETRTSRISVESSSPPPGLDSLRASKANSVLFWLETIILLRGSCVGHAQEQYLVVLKMGLEADQSVPTNLGR